MPPKKMREKVPPATFFKLQDRLNTFLGYDFPPGPKCMKMYLSIN
eukprot:CAMPEP_0119490178 /NCGR_PEP_ID=MMETSP1344-20130328/15429_1 /TAXON_ID=236787 /ORGANISM="Florenciella parvula, Strain CCMP2471" /LENGTH=44 /DNA_ID= /DNA_START= /DNA_END= /DNA_ORIENTATION=